MCSKRRYVEAFVGKATWGWTVGDTEPSNAHKTSKGKNAEGNRGVVKSSTMEDGPTRPASAVCSPLC